MSSSHKHPDAPTQRLSLYAFKLVPVRLMVQSQALIRELLFGGMASSSETAFEIHSVSGYLNYRHTKKLYREEERKNLALPETEEDATCAAYTFLDERYRAFTANLLLQQSIACELTQDKLAYSFSVVPPRQWLKHVASYLVKNDKHKQPDHWLCKFQVEIEAPDGRRMPVLNSSLDVRLGEAAGGGSNYQVVGFQSRWRPVYESYRVEQFLSDTGEPEHDPQEEESEIASGHVHVEELTLLSYVLSDANVPQLNLLPYEATVSGDHHLSVLPASKDSLWVELNVKPFGGKYKVQALLLGGSGNFQAAWGFWNPYGYAFNYRNKKMRKKTKDIKPKQQKPAAQFFEIDTGLDAHVYLAELELDKGIYEVALHVVDVTLQNFIAKRISINIRADETAPPPLAA